MGNYETMVKVLKDNIKALYMEAANVDNEKRKSYIDKISALSSELAELEAKIYGPLSSPEDTLEWMKSLEKEAFKKNEI